MICREPIAVALGLGISITLLVDHFWPKPELCSVQLSQSPVTFKVVECKEEHKFKNIQKIYYAKTDLKENEV